MFNNLRNKIVIPIFAVLVLMITVITIHVSTSRIELVNSFADERMDAASNAVQAYLASLQQQTLIAVTALGGSSELIRHMDDGNRDAVWQYIVAQKNLWGATSIIVTDTEGYAFARSALRDVYGDNVGGGPSISAGLRRETVSLYMPTPTAPLVMTSATPIMDRDRLVGVVAVNFDVATDGFVDRIQSTFDVDVTVFAGDTSVASTLIHPDTGDRATGTAARGDIVETVLGQGQHLAIELDVFGFLPYIAYYFPLMGADGRTPVGMFFVGISQVEVLAASNALRNTMIIIGVLAVMSMTVVVLLTAKGITKPLGVYDGFMRDIAKHGDIEVTPEEAVILGKYRERSDEIGTLFRSYVELTEYIRQVRDNLGAVASGNLNVEVNVRSENDLMSKSLETMIERLNSMFNDINNASSQVASGSKQIADGSQLLAQGSTEQAASMQQLSASIGEIAQKTHENSEKAGRAASLASNIMVSAEKGSGQMDEMMAAVKDINEASQNISKVIKSIDDIAFQTNILALNAAVEAARAGQHGKGFAVVAEEVRNLAAKSAEAAKNTEKLIADSMEKAELGSKIADDTAASLEEIVSGISESSQIVSDIAVSSEEQTVGIDQINKGVDQVAQVVSQNSATAEEAAAASQQMNGQSLILEELVARFSLKNSGSAGALPSAKHDNDFL